MLVLSRKKDESVVIDGDIKVTFLGFANGKARIGIEAPKKRLIRREELAPLVNDSCESGKDTTEPSN